MVFIQQTPSEIAAEKAGFRRGIGFLLTVVGLGDEFSGIPPEIRKKLHALGVRLVEREDPSSRSPLVYEPEAEKFYGLR